jgi:hypothetical protein
MNEYYDVDFEERQHLGLRALVGFAHEDLTAPSTCISIDAHIEQHAYTFAPASTKNYQ